MDEIELVFTILVFGFILGLFVAYLQSRIDKDIWGRVKTLCGIVGGISIIFCVVSGYMLWYFIGLAFFFVALYEPHKEKNKYSGHSGFLFRRRDVPPRFRNPYSRGEERPQLEEWL